MVGILMRITPNLDRPPRQPCRRSQASRQNMNYETCLSLCVQSLTRGNGPRDHIATYLTYPRPSADEWADLLQKTADCGDDATNPPLHESMRVRADKAGDTNRARGAVRPIDAHRGLRRHASRVRAGHANGDDEVTWLTRRTSKRLDKMVSFADMASPAYVMPIFRWSPSVWPSTEAVQAFYEGTP